MKKLLGIILVMSLVFTNLLIQLPLNTLQAVQQQMTSLNNQDFESTTGNWGGNGDATATLSSAQKHGGNQSLALTNRINTWDGAQISLLSLIQENKQYSISAWVYQESGTDQTISISLERTISGTTTYPTIATATVVSGVWTKIQGDYTVEGTHSAAKIYIGSSNATLDFYLDDAEVALYGVPDADPGIITTVISADFESTLGGFGNRGDGTPALTTAQKHSGTQSAIVTGRTQNWQGTELDAMTKCLPNKVYTGSVWVYQSSGSAQTIAMTMNEIIDGTEGYKQLASASVPTDTWTELKGTYSYAGVATKLNLYLEATTPTLDFYLDDFTMKVPGKQWMDRIADGETTTGEWGARIGGEVVTLDSNVAHGGSKSIKVDNRTHTYDGLKYNLTTLVTKGNGYQIEGWIYQTSGSDQTIELSSQYTLSGSDSYPSITSVVVPSGVWTKVAGTLTVDYTGTLDSLTVYFQVPGNATLSFNADDLLIQEIVPDAVSIQTDIPSLAALYVNDFSVGVAIPTSVLTSTIKTDLVKKHFNSITAENNMKPETMLSTVTRGAITFTDADAYEAYAKANGMGLRGHTLIWHSQTPDWFFRENYSDTDPYVTREVMLERMENYIKTVLQHYSSESAIYAWDVVNEAIDESQTDGMRRSNWYNIVGPDFVAKAFEYARLYAAPNVKLFYNDYNVENVTKREFIYDLIAPIKASGNIDGFGNQMHITVDGPGPAIIDQTIKRFAELGLEIHVTELDVDMYSNNSSVMTTPSEALLVKQGYRYKELFDVFKANSAVSNITIWGLTDDMSWLNTFPITRNNWPLLFDKNLQAKPAFWGIADPTQLPIYTQMLTAYEATPIIDGLTDYVWDVTVPKTIIDSEGNSVGTFKTAWNAQSLFVSGKVIDSTTTGNDKITLNIDPNNSKSIALENEDLSINILRTGEVTGAQNVSVSVVEVTGGYTFEVQVPLQGNHEANNEIGFDIVYTNNNSQAFWNDSAKSIPAKPKHFGTLILKEIIKMAVAKKANVAIDGVIDPIWSQVTPISVNKISPITTGASATTKVLWGNTGIYVLTEVTDSLLSKTSGNPWEQDSVEIFIDENMAKTSSYETDDIQYRVNYDNAANSVAPFVSATSRTATGYIVEAFVPFKIANPVAGQMIGFDMQINDDQGSGSRASMANWNDLSGNGYKDTTGFGILKLSNEVATLPVTPTEPTLPQVLPVVVKPIVQTVTPTAIQLTSTHGAVTVSAADVQKMLLTKETDLVVEMTVPNDKKASLEMPIGQVFTKDSKFKSVTMNTSFVSITLEATALGDVKLTKDSQMTLSVEKIAKDQLSKEIQQLTGDQPVYDFNLIIDSKKITQFAQPIEISIPYTLKNGENPQSIIIYFVNDQNQLEVIKNGHFDPVSSKVTFTLNHFSKYFIANHAVNFSDVTTGYWASNAIQYLAARDILKGYGKDIFAPAQGITRSEMVEILVNAFDIPRVEGVSTFTDVTPTAWYASSVGTCEKLQIVSGYGNQKFMPNALVTRQEMAQMIYNALVYKKQINALATGQKTIKDMNQVAAYAKLSTNYLIQAGIISGYTDGTFKPNQVANRSEVAQMIYGILTK